MIGEVTAASGPVTVIKPDGTKKILKVGSKVYLNDQIITESGDDVVITTINNQTFEVGGQLILGESMLSSLPADTDEALSFDEVQAVMTEGTDPAEVAEASATDNEQDRSEDTGTEPASTEKNALDVPVIEHEDAVEDNDRLRSALFSDQTEGAEEAVPSTTPMQPEEEQEEEPGQDGSAEVVVTSYQPVAQSAKMVSSDDGSVLQGQLYAKDNNVGDTLSFSLVSSPEAGSLSIAADGSFEFNPGSDFEYLAAGESQTVSFVFEVTDSRGNKSRASVDISIEGMNEAPEVEGPLTLAVTQEDGSISLNLLQNASDRDVTDQLSVTGLRLVSGNETGVSIGVDGKELVVDPDAYSYLAEGETETIVYEYRVTDSQGGYTTQTASITLAGSNDLPAVEDAIILNVDQRSPLLDIDLLGSTRDVDASDTLNVVNLQLTAGDPVGVSVSDDGSSLAIDSSAYDHLAEGESAPLEYSYDVDDGHGETISQTASIIIEGRNDAPEDIHLSNNVIDENASGIVIGTLSTTDTDSSDTHTYTVDDHRFEVTNGQLRLKSGIFLDHETEAFVTVNVTTTDNNEATFTEAFTIDVNDINEAPETTASSTTVQEDSLYRFSLTDFPYSGDNGDRLESVLIDTLPAKGIVELNGLAVSAGSEISRADIEAGNLTFLPDAHESADDYASFQFRVNDGHLTSSAQAFTINVAPVVDAASLSLNSSETVTTLGFENGMGDWTSVNDLESHGSGLIGDPHGGSRLAELDNGSGGVPDAYSYNVDTSRGHDHQLTLWLRQRDSYDSTDDVEIVWNGEVVATFDPETSWGEFMVTLPHVDQASTQIQIREVASQNDGLGPIVDDISVVRVAAEDSADPAYDYSISSFEDTFIPLTLNQSLVDADGSESLALSLSGIPANSTLTDGSNTVTTDGSDVDISNWQHNLLRMIPPENSNTDFVLTFTTTSIESATGESVSVARTLHVDLIPVSDAAIISGVDSGDIAEDDTATLTASGTLTITDVDTGEEHFQAETLTGSYGQLVIDTSGSWVYTADNSQGAIQNLGVSETLTDSFTVHAQDGTGHTVTATLHGTNDAPVLTAGATLAYIEDDGGQIIDAHISLVDIDSATIDTASISISGHYVPGEDSLGFTDHNGISGDWDSASGILTLTGTATVAQYQEALRAVTYNNHSDSPDTTGRTISFSVNDGYDTSNIATSTITVTAVSDAPETVNASATIDEDTPYIFSSGDFAFSDVDAGDEFEGIQIATLPAAGTLLFNNSAATVGQNISKQDLLAGRLKFEPELNANGNHYASFDFKVNDGELLSDAASFEVNVTPLYDAPVVSGNISQNSGEDVSLTVTEAELLVNASDFDGGTLSVSNLRVSSGQVSVADNGDSTWTITPGSDWSGAAEVQFDITDGTVVITSQLDLTVDAVADEPVLTLDGNPIGNAAFSGSNTELINDDSGPHTFSGSPGDELAYNNTGISPSADYMTVSFWMKWDGSQSVMPVSFGRYDIWIYSNSIGFNDWNSNIYGLYLNELQLAEGSSGLANEWHHIVATFNDGDASRNTLRIDGITQNLSDVHTGSTRSSSNANIHQPLYFGGGDNNAESYQFKGNIDGIKVYEGTMTDAEALSLYELEAASTNYHSGVAATAPELAGTEDTDITLDLGSSLSDSDGSESLAISLGGIPSGFVLTDGSNTVTSDGSSIDVTGWSLDSLTLSPAANYDSDFTIVVTATSTESDGGDTSQITRDIHIQMQAVNDVAVITGDDSGAVTEDAGSTLSVSGALSVSDVDAGESAFNAETVTGTYGSLSIDVNGNWSYSADNTQSAIQSLGDIESLTEIFSVSSLDGTTHNVVITINGHNDIASSSDQLITLDEDSTYTFSTSDFSFSDADASNSLQSVTITQLPASGNLQLSGVDVNASDTIAVSDIGNLTFSPAVNANGDGYASLQFTVSDGITNSSGQTLTFNVTAVNDAPELLYALDDQTTAEETAFSYTLPESAFGDQEGDTITFSATLLNGDPLPAWLSFDAASRTFSGTPGDLDTGTVSVKIVLSDGVKTTDVFWSVNVTPVNDAPEATDDTINGGTGADTIDAGAGDDTVTGDDAGAIPVNLDAGFISQAGQITLPAATGLKGEFFETSTVFSALSEAVALTINSTPKATFIASAFNYAKSDGTLAGFLGSDGNSLSGHGTASDETFALKLTGYIRLSAGTHDFNVTSDDGFSLKINHQTVTEFTTPGGTDSSSGNYTAAQDGLYDVELIYWQGSSGADMNITSTSLGTMEFYEALPAGAEQVDGQTYYHLPTPDVVVDVADGVTLSAGTNNGDGTWTLKEADLSGLTMTSTDKSWNDSLTFNMVKDTRRTISIADSSFESAGTQANGEFVHQPSASAWSFSGSSDGIHDYDSSAFNDQSADDTGGEEATDGYNAAFINTDGGVISQTLSENFDPNTAYELKVDIGNHKNSAGMGDYEVRITAGGVTLVADGSLTPAEGEFETLTINLDGSAIAADSAAVGQPITIELVKSSGYQVAFDNVRMTAVTTEQITQETVNTDQSDQIIGGAGNDILTGGHDSDTFVWHASDVGTADSPSVDLLTDFHLGQGGDILDLSDVLVDEENHQLDEYLHFNFSDGNTTLEISTQANGDVTQKVTLQGVDLSPLGGTDSEIINNLLNDGNLQVDQ